MIENEFKVMLTEEQYNKIHSIYDWDKEHEQTNYYYDTPELQLISAHITCRVRLIDGEYLLQMKLPNGAAYSRRELEQRLGGELPEKLNAHQLTALSGVEALPDVSLIGELSTLRSVKRLDGAEIDLDKSTYFGKTDYELEIEFTDEATARCILSLIADEVGLTIGADVCYGKVHRFIAEYNKTNP